MQVFYRHLKAFVGAIGILVCLFAVLTVSAQGQTDGNKTAEPTAVIETKRDVGADRSIKERLQAIYREIDALSDVQVHVNEGVVSLSGAVANDGAAERAHRTCNAPSGRCRR